MKNNILRVLGISAFVCVLVSTLLVVSVQAFSNDGDSSPSGNLHDDHKDQVWCHKFDDRKCIEDKKDDCRGDWKEGKCEKEKEDQCSNIDGKQKTVPANMQTNSDHICSCVPGFHEVPVITDSVKTEDVQQDFTCEADPTPTPVPPSNPGGPGDGRSDGRSDGLSSCPSCTAPPQGQVLGATTFAGTGVADDVLMNVVGAFGGLSTAAGLVMAAKKKS